MDMDTLLRIPSGYPRTFVLPVVFRLFWLGRTQGDLYVKQETNEDKPHWYFRTSPLELLQAYPESEREKHSSAIEEILGVSRGSESVFLRLGKRNLGGILETWTKTSGQRDIKADDPQLDGLISPFLVMESFVAPTIEQFDTGWLKTHYPKEEESENTTEMVTWPDRVADKTFAFAYQFNGAEANTTSSSEMAMAVGDGGVTAISLDEWEMPFSKLK